MISDAADITARKREEDVAKESAGGETGTQRSADDVQLCLCDHCYAATAASSWPAASSTGIGRLGACSPKVDDRRKSSDFDNETILAKSSAEKEEKTDCEERAADNNLAQKNGDDDAGPSFRVRDEPNSRAKANAEKEMTGGKERAINRNNNLDKRNSVDDGAGPSLSVRDESSFRVEANAETEKTGGEERAVNGNLENATDENISPSTSGVSTCEYACRALRVQS
jgi:hypothetical protein